MDFAECNAFRFSRNDSLACVGIFHMLIKLQLHRSYTIDRVTLLVLISVNVIQGCDNKHQADVRPCEASRGNCELVGLLLSITTVRYWLKLIIPTTYVQMSPHRFVLT